MRRLLLTIEAAFDTRLFPHGAILAPALPFDALTPPYPTVVRLKRPDGAEIETGARFAQTHFNRPYSERTIANTWMLTVALTDITKAGIPIGSEIWVELPNEVNPPASPD